MIRWLSQTLAVSALSVRTIPQRASSSAVAMIGIAGVVIVFVAVLSIGEGFRAAMADASVQPVISLRMGMALLAVAPLTVASVNAARNRLLATLNHAADHDALTGVLNRSAFLRRGLELAEHMQRTGGTVAAMMLDIDHFKSVNDRHGHAAGDAVLTTFASRMRDHLREDGLFGRFGGEEFAVLLTGVDAAAALVVAERLRLLASELIPLEDGRLLDITVSVGVASAPARMAGLEQLLSQADVALYRAKAMGRNRVVGA